MRRPGSPADIAAALYLAAPAASPLSGSLEGPKSGKTAEATFPARVSPARFDRDAWALWLSGRSRFRPLTGWC